MSSCIPGKTSCFFSTYQPSTVDRVYGHIEVYKDQLEFLDTQGTLCQQPSNVCIINVEHIMQCEYAHKNMKC